MPNNLVYLFEKSGLEIYKVTENETNGVAIVFLQESLEPAQSITRKRLIIKILMSLNPE